MKALTHKLIDGFETYIPNLIDEKGIYPAPMLVQKPNEHYALHALDLTPDQCWQHFLTSTLDSEVTGAIFGLDRSTKPGQGTEFADVLTCVLYEPAAGLEYRVRDQFHFGVINYRHEPRIVRPIDWKNPHWNRVLRAELNAFMPPLVIRRKA